MAFEAGRPRTSGRTKPRRVRAVRRTREPKLVGPSGPRTHRRFADSGAVAPLPSHGMPSAAHHPALGMVGYFFHSRLWRIPVPGSDRFDWF
jgi:hypothetical protein